MTDEQIQKNADQYLKDHKADILEMFASPEHYFPTETPVTIFMAGSPGAGKTEVASALFDELRSMKSPPVRIDADMIRSMLPGYVGGNAHVFQKTASTGVHILFDYALKHNLNVILDGTFSHSSASQNIERSLKRGRTVIIYFVYQDPLIAWRFTQAREAIEGRRVTKETFINAFLKSRDNVRLVKEQFGSEIRLDVILKDFTHDIGQVFTDVAEIDQFLPKAYTKEELETLI
ncbi:MAG: zeta toxin family protein [Patescibacteria group bacterium]